MSEDREFDRDNQKKIKKMGKDQEFLKISKKWFLKSVEHEYSYHFTWLGRPIIQYPQDILAMQEIIWKVKPDVIIETGIARGGSLILSASILELIGKGQVIGIDIDLRKKNKNAIKKHSMAKRIKTIEGSSIDQAVIKKVRKIIGKRKKILVFLDSNHTYEHVAKELEIYSEFVKKGSYLVVFDTVIDDLPEDNHSRKMKKPWGKKNNPKIAVKKFLKNNKRFIVDEMLDSKLMLSVGPSGYLFCVKS
jgi:cephalosporin hydroxylase